MFKEQELHLPGFKHETIILRELSLRAMAAVEKAQSDDDSSIELMFKQLEQMMHLPTGEKLCNDNYTIDDFADEIPMSQMDAIAEAFNQLNLTSEPAALDAAKNS